MVSGSASRSPRKVTRRTRSLEARADVEFFVSKHFDITARTSQRLTRIDIEELVLLALSPTEAELVQAGTDASDAGEELLVGCARETRISPVWTP